jgi:hypothetical protein
MGDKCSMQYRAERKAWNISYRKTERENVFGREYLGPEETILLKGILSKSWSYKENPLSSTESFQKND